MRGRFLMLTLPTQEKGRFFIRIWSWGCSGLEQEKGVGKKFKIIALIIVSLITGSIA